MFIVTSDVILIHNMNMTFSNSTNAAETAVRVFTVKKLS